MKKTTIALSLAAALATSSFGSPLTHTDLQAQIEALKSQIPKYELCSLLTFLDRLSVYFLCKHCLIFSLETGWRQLKILSRDNFQ